MDRFGLSIQHAQYSLFVFLLGAAVGTIVGGPIGDRIGRKRVIWGSILGVAPLTLVLPYVNLETTIILVLYFGSIISSAFPALVVYGQALVRGQTGTVSGPVFRLSFGVSGIRVGDLGSLALSTRIQIIYPQYAVL